MGSSTKLNCWVYGGENYSWMGLNTDTKPSPLWGAAGWSCLISPGASNWLSGRHPTVEWTYGICVGEQYYSLLMSVVSIVLLFSEHVISLFSKSICFRIVIDYYCLVLLFTINYYCLVLYLYVSYFGLLFFCLDSYLGTWYPVDPTSAHALSCSSRRRRRNIIIHLVELYLVGGWATPLKNMEVNWDDIPNIWENAKNGNQTTNQIL